MSTEPQCSLCWYHIKMEETAFANKLLCVNRKSSCWGKIVKPLFQCDLFSDYIEKDPVAKKIMEDTSEANDITAAMRILRESKRVCGELDQN